MQTKLHVSTIIAEKNKILLVQEKKKANYGRWNLPGGHVDAGESFIQAAIREVLEETGLNVNLKSIIGVYTGYIKPLYFVRTVFAAYKTKIILNRGKDVLDARLFSMNEILKMKKDKLVRADVLKQIVKDYSEGVSYNLKLLKNLIE